jgi:hypothetical protein
MQYRAPLKIRTGKNSQSENKKPRRSATRRGFFLDNAIEDSAIARQSGANNNDANYALFFHSGLNKGQI